MRSAAVWLLVGVLSSCGEAAPETPPSAPAATEPAATEPAATEPAAIEPATPDPARGTPLAIATGSVFACALREGGRVACWGSNVEGQLGQLHREPVEGAVHVAGLEDAIAIAASSATACALRRSGEVVCWGSNTGGGLGLEGGARSGVVTVPGLHDVRGLDVGGGTFFAWGDDGVVLAWGAPDSRIDEASERSDAAPRRTRLRDVVRIETGRDRIALHRDGHASAWGWERGAVERLEDVVVATSSSGGTCLGDRAGVVRCTLHTGSGVEERIPEALAGTETLVFPRGGLIAGLRDGRLLVFSYYAGSTDRFAESDALVALGRGLGSHLTAITRDGRVLAWDTAPREGVYLPTEIALPAPDADAPEPALPDGPMPRWCRVEVERIAAPPRMSLDAAVAAALHEDTPGLVPGDLCASMRVTVGDPNCPYAGPWLGLGTDVGAVSVVVPLPALQARLLSRVAADWSGTEEFDVLERWSLRSAHPLRLAMITSRGEPTDDPDLGISPGEVARDAVVVLETPEGDFVEVRARADLLRMRRAGGQLDRLPDARLDGAEIELWACGGRGRYPIPSTATDRYTAGERAAPPSVAPIAEAPPPEAPPAAGASDATDAPSEDEVSAARAECNEGFAALSRGDTERARTAIDHALTVLTRATDAAARRTLGACLYNRGRLSELDGDAAAARRYYERSLEARPNATVEERMRSLAH